MSLINNKGFTLLSLLISISVLFLLTPMIVHFISFIQSVESSYDQSELEIRHVHFFIQNEVNRSIKQHYNDYSISLVNQDGTTIKYELYGDQIRRRVNNTGHEVILRNVKEFKVSKLNEQTYKIVISKGDQHTFERIYFMQNFEEHPPYS
ncbi:competence type IV pilus minor pilin ComGF [Piscibacillus salipiscarius]